MYDERIVAILLAAKPQQIVLVGRSVSRLSQLLDSQLRHWDSTEAAPEVVHLESPQHEIEGDQPIAASPNSTVICLDLPNNVENPDVWLGWACRNASKLVLVEQSCSDSEVPLLPEKHFFAFGFRVVEKIDEPDLKRALYAYSLSDYKRAPDWLNARFWANPERFDLQE